MPLITTRREEFEKKKRGAPKHPSTPLTACLRHVVALLWRWDSGHNEKTKEEEEDK